jgi:hypothetical protein
MGADLLIVGGLKRRCEAGTGIEEAPITGHAGVPLVIELFRASGAAAVMDAQVQLIQRARGLSVSQTAESLFALWSAGGERCEDLYERTPEMKEGRGRFSRSRTG